MQVKKSWYRLDNAAIIIPPSTRGSCTRVFRIVCQMKENVDPAVLQEALDTVCEEFPHFNVVLRSGLFWYYLDNTGLRPRVHKDHKPACGPLYVHGKRNLLYEISYYRNRINLEMFHVLSDGTGAFVFFRKLIITYIRLCHNIPVVFEDDNSSMRDKTDDAFRRFYQRDTSSEQLKNTTRQKAYQLKGDIDENMNNHLLELSVSASQFSQAAKAHQTTVGILATSLYLKSIVHEMSIHDRKSPVVISVPVNLRSYFPSETTRNFYGTINISYTAGTSDPSLKDMIEYVKAQFQQLLRPEEIRRNMNSYSALEHNFAIKLIPLFIKDIAVAYFSNRSARGVTGTISNLGRIEMPPEAVPYIDYFSAFMAKQNMQITIAAFQDILTLGICTNLTNHTVIHEFVKNLHELGICASLATNDNERMENECSIVQNAE